MKTKDVIDFANKNKTCFLSTVENYQPRGRVMLMWFADESGFYFHTGTMKALYTQLKDNPNVELCFFSASEQKGGRMLRVSGRIDFVNELKAKLIEERPFTKEFGEQLTIFKLSNGEAHFWSMENNTKEGEIERIVV